MNHADISRRLALAIGYPPECIRDLDVCVGVYRDGGPYGGGEGWYTFDYRNPTVALPMLRSLLIHGVNVWYGVPDKWKWSEPMGGYGKTDTLEEAIARAAIEVAK